MTTPARKVEDLAKDFVSYIDEGYFDDHLRMIARACFSRRDTLTGSSTVIPDPPPPPTDSTATVGGVTKHAAYNSVGAFVGSILSNRVGGDPGVDFMYNGKWYLKSMLKGEVIIIPRGISTKMDAYEGQRVRIKGFGNAVSCVTLNDDKHHFFPKSILKDILG